MHHVLRIIYLCLIALLAVSCGKRDSFKVECQTSPDLVRQLVFTYANAQGIRQVQKHLENGRTELEGQSKTPTLLTVSFADGTLIASCIVENGDKVKIHFDTDEEGSGAITDVSVKGNKSTKRLREFEAENDSLISLGFSPALSHAVTDYLKANPDDPVSTVLFLRYYDSRDHEASADSLMMLLSPQARPATLLQNYGAITARQLNTSINDRLYSFDMLSTTDSVVNIRFGRRRHTLLAFLPGRTSPERTSQLDSLRKLWPDRDSLHLAVVEISLANDSAEWRAETALDSVGWRRAWLPGNVSSAPLRKLAIPRQPFYILVDSTGMQIYRGSSFEEAHREISVNLTRKKHPHLR